LAAKLVVREHLDGVEETDESDMLEAAIARTINQGDLLQAARLHKENGSTCGTSHWSGAMAKITPAQVHHQLTATQDFTRAADAATQARDHIDHLFLNVARTAKVGLRELTAVTGPHHAAIRAAIRRAIGPGARDGWEQPSLIDFLESLEPMRALRLGAAEPGSSGSVTRLAPVLTL
jgi:hypothetical protein